MTTSNELEKFNKVIRKIMAVPREEILRRDKEWREERARKKRRELASDTPTKKND